MGLSALSKVNLSNIDVNKLNSITAVSRVSAIKAKIPGMAQGGIVQSTGPVVVGERGPQIVQLPKNTRVRNNNQYNQINNNNNKTNLLLNTVISKLDQLIDKTPNVYLDGRLVTQLLIKNKITY